MTNRLTGRLFQVAAISCAMLVASLALLRQPSIGDALLWRINALTPSPGTLERYHVTWQLKQLNGRAPLVSPGAIWLLGDSHLASIPDQRIANAANFSVGGLTTRRLMAQLAAWPELHSASAVILSIGTNDLVACGVKGDGNASTVQT